MRTVLRIAQADMLSAWRRLQSRRELQVAVVLATLMCGLPLTVAGFAFGAALGAQGSALPALADVYLGTGLAYLLLALPVTLSTFFTDRALLLLTLAPLRAEQVFAARLAASSRTALIVVWPVLTVSLGVGVGARAAPLYFMAAMPLALIWPAALTAAQVGLLSLVLRVVPPAHVRSATVSLSMFLVLAAWSVQLVTIGRAQRTIGQLQVMSTEASWLPLAQGLAGLTAGRRDDATLWLPVSSLALFLVLLGAVAAYRHAVVSGAAAGALAPAPARRLQREPAARRNTPAAPIAAMVRKDWLLFSRDPRRLVQIVPLLMFIWPLWRINSVSPAAQPLPGVFWLNLTVLGLVPFLLSGAFGLFALSAEKAGFQLLRLAPRTAGWVLRAKLWFALPPLLVLTAAATVLVFNLAGSPPLQVAVALLTTGWLAAGLGTISVAAGTIWPNLTSGAGGQPLQVGGSFALFFIDAGFWTLSALSVAFIALEMGGDLTGPAAALVVLLACLALAGAAAIPARMLVLAGRSLMRMEPAPPS